MTTYDASVKKALTASQQDLINHKEHCSADPEKLATVGREGGHQVRIKRNDSEYALYTISQVRQERPDNIIRMGSTGRERLGTSDEFVGSLDSQVPHPTFDDADAETNNEFVERLKDNGTHIGLIVIAPHGGDIEPHTDQQAEHVASRLAAKGVSLWRCKGFKGEDAFARWHITSTDIHEASFPLLNSVISRGFTYAIAFHGFDDPEISFDILIGGAASYSLKQEVETAIKGATTGSDITVHIASSDEKFGGDSLKNIVNRLTASGANGIQIEQSPRARSNHWREIADVVANVYSSKLG
ncbi:MAG TPA: poly-gamma-glutamate hydrolase family protein [Methyloceanibacter sp.]|nr:poly-gamma-glutamate hydrolase family protein [Methyloceanibacter sp.]